MGTGGKHEAKTGSNLEILEGEEVKHNRFKSVGYTDEERGMKGMEVSVQLGIEEM